MSEDISKLKEEEQENEEPESGTSTRGRSRRRHGSNWVGGLILIAIGVFFLLQNFFDFRFDNWWALFILIPALYSLGNAYNNYRENGRLNNEGRGSLIGGLILVTIALIFLLGLSWSVMWPVFIIIAGLGALLNAAWS